MSNMVVRTNVMALNSHRNLGNVSTQQARSSARLSSGFRINSAADDAAGLGISEKMRGQIRGLDQASRNAQDGISLIQTAEGAMSTVNEMVIRIRELVVQASNDTNAHESGNLAQSDRMRIQDEINQLMDEIDATRNRTQFNTRNLIDGSLSGTPGTAPMSDDVRALVNTFLAEGPVAGAVTDLEAALENVAAWDDDIQNVTNLRDRINEIGTDITNATNVGALTTLVTQIANDWAAGVNDGSITNVTEQDQADFVNAALAAHFGIALTDAEVDDADMLGAGGLTVANVGDIVTAIQAGGGTVDLQDGLTAAALTGDGLVGNGTAVTVPNLEGTGGTTPTLPGLPSSHADITVQVGNANTAIGVMLGNQGIAQNVANGHMTTLNNLLAADDTLGEMFGSFQEMMDAYNAQGTENNAIWFQIGANVDQGVRLSIEDIGTAALSAIGTNGQRADDIGNHTFARLRTAESTNLVHGPGGAPTFDEAGGVINASGEDIQRFITAIDEALAHVTAQRSNLGAMQNRLEFTIENLDIASQNLSAAESRIRDADMAAEMMRLTQANVLQQAATSMLAQANQAPQSILQLLG